jgi:membrane associated rhomboid family serine protease
MVTSTLSHGSWDHLIGNLIFFISFSLIVETVLGAALYIMVFFGMAFGIATVDNLVHLGTESVPTLGLSGVVMGMIALVAYFAPRVKINFLWVFFFFGVPLYPAVISFPALGVAGWYVAWDVAAHLLFRDWSPVNYVAHLAGVLVALVLGITVFREKRHWAQDLLLDEPALKQVDDHWLTRFRQITAVPAVLYFATIAYLLLLGLFVWFMSLYSVPLLMVAPILSGSYYVYRSHKESNTPDSVRFKQAMDDMVSSRFGMGLPAMMKLAEGGYTRAQIELAKLYEQGRGVPKLDSKAAEWYRRAAESGNSHAQYCLALMMMQGRTVFHRKEEPIEWLEKSARQGVPEPAMSLAHYYARGRGGEREPEKACHWYHHAGKLYLQQGRLQDLDVVVKEIRSVDPDYEHLPALEAALKRES